MQSFFKLRTFRKNRPNFKHSSFCVTEKGYKIPALDMKVRRNATEVLRNSLRLY